MAKNTWLSIEDIQNVPVPARTDSYCPVPQYHLLDQVVTSFGNAGYDTGETNHKMHRNKAIFISEFDVNNSNAPETERMKWTVAVINSYNKSKAIRLVFGGKVFACLNGMVVADHILRTKHTTNVWDRLPSLIDRAVSAYSDEVSRAGEFYADLRKKYTSNSTLSEFAIFIAKNDILPKASVLEFYQEAVNPSFNYETDNWCLYNVHAAFTHIAKSFNPIIRPNRILKFERALKSAYDLV